jgi:bleomycin hydrolase
MIAKKTLGLILAISLLGAPASSFAKKKKKKDKVEGYQFTTLIDLPTTSVKDQHASGTCWCFSGLSFLESELIRMGKGDMDLSEMFLVKKAYHEKAKLYVRYHGKLAFSGGGESNDVMDMIKLYGLAPESAFKGLNYGEENHRHGEMDAVLEAMVNAVIKNRNRKLTPVWIKGIDATLDAYLGEDPTTFTYKDKSYTPKSFQKELGINPDDYVEITSFSHHPFYSKFIMEVPDNWAQGQVYNLPLDEFMSTLNYALENGYSALWGSDVSEKGFSSRNGVAIIPEVDTKNMSGAEIAKWEKMSQRDKNKKLYDFSRPGKEKVITQEVRQEGFDNYQSQDDHGMHITGTAKDQNGTLYFKVKNSWGDYNKYDGYFYASESFVKAKTMTYMIHKDALPKEIAKKLGIK